MANRHRLEAETKMKMKLEKTVVKLGTQTAKRQKKGKKKEGRRKQSDKDRFSTTRQAGRNKEKHAYVSCVSSSKRSNRGDEGARQISPHTPMFTRDLRLFQKALLLFSAKQTRLRTRTK